MYFGFLIIYIKKLFFNSFRSFITRIALRRAYGSPVYSASQVDSAILAEADSSRWLAQCCIRGGSGLYRSLSSRLGPNCPQNQHLQRARVFLNYLAEWSAPAPPFLGSINLSTWELIRAQILVIPWTGHIDEHCMRCPFSYLFPRN